MTRRSAVLAAGWMLLVVLASVGAVLPVPYVQQVPGPVYDTLGERDGRPLIVLEGRDRDDASGTLNITTINVKSPMTLVQAVRGWFDDETIVLPRESVYPPDRTVEETLQANREAFLTSEEAATSAALRHLGYPAKVVVREFPEDSPSAEVLQEGDAVVSVDGRQTPDLATLTDVLTGIPAGTDVEVEYRRLGRSGSATVTTAEASDREGSLLGISVREMPSAPFDVDFQIDKVGGPSGGLMLALGIVELAEDEDLTGGALIAGTGTIDEQGNVGRIGGIRLKAVTVEELGADLFLVPADNCAELLGAGEPGVPTARVATLDDALAALEDQRAGRAPEPC